MYPYTVEDSAGTGKVFFQVQFFIFIQYLTLMYLVSIETIYFGHLLSKPYSKKKSSKHIEWPYKMQNKDTYILGVAFGGSKCKSSKNNHFRPNQ